MKTEKHTPGPWRHGIRGVCTYDGHLICESVTPANARLMAAGPEMLEALREIEEGSGAFSTDYLQHAANCIENMRELARVAIAKATGGQDDE